MLEQQPVADVVKSLVESIGVRTGADIQCSLKTCGGKFRLPNEARASPEPTDVCEIT
jgi:hypothetical protein